jgi:hypothetical protein
MNEFEQIIQNVHCIRRETLRALDTETRTFVLTSSFNALNEVYCLLEIAKRLNTTLTDEMVEAYYNSDLNTLAQCIINAKRESCDN